MQVIDVYQMNNDFLEFKYNNSSISKDTQQISDFITIFTHEHGELPAFDLFESCEQMNKR